MSLQLPIPSRRVHSIFISGRNVIMRQHCCATTLKTSESSDNCVTIYVRRIERSVSRSQRSDRPEFEISCRCIGVVARVARQPNKHVPSKLTRTTGASLSRGYINNNQFRLPPTVHFFSHAARALHPHTGILYTKHHQVYRLVPARVHRDL